MVLFSGAGGKHKVGLYRVILLFIQQSGNQYPVSDVFFSALYRFMIITDDRQRDPAEDVA